MGKTVDVFNRDDAPYTETWKEKTITIPARGTIRMNRRDAMDFLGALSKPLENGGFVPKMLVIKEIEEAKAEKEAPRFVCNLDGQEFPNQSALDKHLATHKDKVMKEK